MGRAQNIAPCPLPKFSPLQVLQKSSQGYWALLPPRAAGSNWCPGCDRTRAPGGGQKQRRNGKNPREAECGCPGLPGSSSSCSLTCCEIRVLLKVGYDEVAEDVEAGEEQGTDLWAEECGQCGHTLRAAPGSYPRRMVMMPTLGLVSSTLFVFPLLALVTRVSYTSFACSDRSVQWGLHTGFTHGCPQAGTAPSTHPIMPESARATANL